MAGTPPNGSSGSNDDDIEISIEGKPVAAAPAPAPRKRARTPNPAADEIIHTGEIGEAPRSLIVRSSPNIPVEPKIQIREEPTEPVTPVRPPAPAGAKSRLPLIIGAAALVLGGAGVAVMLSKGGGGTKAAAPSPTQPTTAPAAASNLSSLADFIGTTLDADAHAAMVRAEAIASSSMLRAGIETDAKTLADMAKDNDVTFPIKRGEVVDVIQVKDAGRSPLLHWPADAPQIPAPPAGKMQLAQVNGVLAVIATATIAKRQGSSVSGEIVIAVPIDLEVIRKKVTIPSSIVGLASPVVIVGGGKGAKQTAKIDTEMKAPISLEAMP
jgi:hypothetical protein